MKVFAVPALPLIQQFTQPDGSTFEGRNNGDEWFNWQETVDRRVIIFNKSNKFFEFAEFQYRNGEPSLVPSGVKVKNLQYRQLNGTPYFQAITPDQLKELRNNALRKYK